VISYKTVRCHKSEEYSMFHQSVFFLSVEDKFRTHKKVKYYDLPYVNPKMTKNFEILQLSKLILKLQVAVVSNSKHSRSF
jgi:hypothetical protein